MLNALENTYGQDSYWVRSSENAIEVFEEYLKKHFSLDSLPEKERMHLRMFVYAVTEAYAYWALNDMSIPMEEMADWFFVNCNLLRNEYNLIYNSEIKGFNHE